MMADYMDRVIEEKRELDAKRSKLSAFLDGEIYLTLDEAEQDLLVEQMILMKMYSEVLGQRIARWAA